MMSGNGRIDQFGPDLPEPMKSAVLVGSHKPRISRHIGGKDRGESGSFFGHPGLAQTGEVSRFEQGADRRHPPISRCPQADDA